MNDVLCCLVLALAIWTIIVWMAASRRRHWKEKWPSINDDEFMQRCPQGTSREVALKVRQIVAKHTGIEYEHIHPQQNFVDDLL